MNNDEIRLKIAELKGWTKIKQNIVLIGCDPLGNYYNSVPNWPESIADAVSLFDDVEGDIHIKREFGMWQVIIPGEGRGGFVGKNESFPVAICEAYIPWRESNALP